MSEPVDFHRLGDLLDQLLCDSSPRTGANRGPESDGAGVEPGVIQADHGRGDKNPTVPRRPEAGRRGDLSAERDPGKALAEIWQEVLGAEVAANAQPVQLRHGRLVVSTSSSAWAQTLQLMGDAVAGRLNERLGYEAVKIVVFRHAGWEDRPIRSPSADLPSSGPSESRKGQPRQPPLSARQKAVLDEVETLEMSPELRRSIRGAIEAIFIRAQQDSVR